MASSEHILNEIKEISPLLADMIRTNPYTLPQGYFEGLPDAIFKKIAEEPVKLPAAAVTYRVPANYFENLPDLILSNIQKSGEIQEELEAVAPLLNTISKAQVFSLPDGYFEKLQPRIYNNSVAQEQAKLVKFRNYGRWIQYAAAAMVTGILITGAFFFTDSNSYLEQEKKGRIQQGIPDTARDAGILKPELDSADETADNASDNDKTVEEANNAIIKPARSRSALELLSDEELKKYLEENAIPETVYPENIEIEDSI